MANNNNDLLSLSTMLDALPKLRFPTAKESLSEDTPPIPPPPRGVSAPIPRETLVTKQKYQPYGFCAVSNSQEPEYHLQGIFNFMTTKQDFTQFKETVSKLDRGELHRIAYLMTSDPDYFMDIARNEYGSRRMQKLLGKSDDVDALFCAAIVRLFLYVMTDKNASHVAVHAMRFFDGQKKESMCELILRYALQLACDQHGCVALNEIITDLDHPYYRVQLLDVIAHNAVTLSNDAYGNFVIQHVLKLNNLSYTRILAVRLRGHFVDLSVRKRESYIVERLLEKDEAMAMVVKELLECENDRLVRLARSDYGNFVVAKALEVTREDKIRASLFWGLVHKLTPLLPLLRRSRGNKIAAILDSICKPVLN